MVFKKTYSISITVALLLLCTIIKGQDIEKDTLKKWYVPSNVRLQFAGNIGFLSLGPSWSFLNYRLDFESSFGFVPKLDAKKPIYIIATKTLYKPNLDFKIKKVTTPISTNGKAQHFT